MPEQSFLGKKGVDIILKYAEKIPLNSDQLRKKHAYIFRSGIFSQHTFSTSMVIVEKSLVLAFGG